MILIVLCRVEIEMEQIKNTLMRIDLLKTYTCSFPAIRQTNEYNCGPTSALQALYGAGVANNVSGSTYSEKIDTLQTLSKTDTTGTIVDNLRVALNTYLSSSTYVWTQGINMNLDTFGTNVISSLSKNRPPLLHSLTSSFDYYNGKNFRHYIAIYSANKATGAVTVNDCHINDPYYGLHYVNMNQAYNSITQQSGRCLLHA